MIYVVATIELVEGTREAFLAEQRHLLPLVRAEQGCIEYVPTVDLSMGHPPQAQPREHCVTVQEKWQSLDHLKAHAAAQHMADFRAKTKQMVKGVKVEVFQPI